jgi:hypothetical protein
MAECPNYNCVGWDPYTEGVCGATFDGGSAQVVLLKCGQTITASKTNAAALGVEIAAMIAAGNAQLLSNLLVQFGEPSAVTQESFIAGATPQPVTYDRSVTIVDQNVNAGTIDFWNSINGATGAKVGGILIYEGAENDRCTFIDNVLTLAGGRIFTNNELQRFSFAANYRAKTDAPIYAVPDNIFD